MGSLDARMGLLDTAYQQVASQLDLNPRAMSDHTRIMDGIERRQESLSQQMAATAEAVAKLGSPTYPFAVEDGAVDSDRVTGKGILNSPPVSGWRGVPSAGAAALGSSSSPRPLDPGIGAVAARGEVGRGRGRPQDEHLGGGRHVLPKMSFPRFDGSFPRLWRDNCLDYFQVFNISPYMWLTTARLHLEGNAAHWFQAYKLRHEVNTWQEFITAVETKFGVDDHQQFMSALIQLKQKGTVAEYCTAFQEFMFKQCGHNPYYDETMFVGHFLRGLNQEIRVAVASQIPETVDRAILLAHVQEHLSAQNKPWAAKYPTAAKPDAPKAAMKFRQGDMWKERKLKECDPTHVCAVKNQAVVEALTVEDHSVQITPEVLNLLELQGIAEAQQLSLSLNASPAAVVLDGDLKHDADPFSNEDYHGVSTHVVGMSLFLEVCLDHANDIGDSVLTSVGGSSLFLEIGLDSENEELSGTSLTHVGSVSLFLEPCVESAGVVFSKPHQMDCEDGVFTIVGGVSLFQELCVEVSNVMAKMLPEEVWEDDISDQVLTHVGSVSLFAEIDMEIHQVLEDSMNKVTCLGHTTSIGVNQVCLVLTFEKGKLQLSRDEISQCNLWFCIGGKSDAQFSCHQLRNLRFLLYHGNSSGILILPWDPGTQEELDDVLNNVGGLSLFLELVMDTTDQVLDAKLLKDEQRSDAMFTQVAALHTKCRTQQEKGCAPDIQIINMDSSADNFYGMIKKNLKLAKQWDPGIVNVTSRRVSYAISLFYGFTQSTPVQLIPKCSNIFLDNNVCITILLQARLKCKSFLTLIHKCLCDMIFSAWDVYTIRNLFNIHSVYFCSVAQSIICTLGRPWDPGIVAIREWPVQCDISAEVGAAAAICDRIDRAIAWGQAMFLGGGIVTPDTLGKVGLGFMGRQYRWMTILGAARQEESIEEQNRTRVVPVLSPVPFFSGSCPSGDLLRWPLSTSGGIPNLTPR